MRKAHILVYFAVVNCAGICFFYLWILSSQFRKHGTRYMHPDAFIYSDNEESVQRYEHRVGFLPQAHEKSRTSSSGSLDKIDHTLKPPAASKTFSPQIPPVPKDSSGGDDVQILDKEIMKKYLKYPKRKANETVLILTPIHNSAAQLKTYLRLLQSITYPHLLISVALGEDSSNDNTLHIAHDIALELKKSFRSVRVFHFNITGQVDGTWFNIHTVVNQYKRRKHLAQARNLLLNSALRHHDWVLWVDSDVGYFAPDIIQQLISAGKDVVAPLCIYKDHKRKRVYDKNTWRETPASLSYQKSLSDKELVFEGYGQTRRLWLSDLRAEGRVVPIDGVGGCTLLVRASCHRKGAVFPEEPFQHHLETEGFAKMAKSMNCSVYGMPFVEVIHT